MEMGDLLAHHLGDGRPLARGEIGRGQGAQLPAHRLVQRRDRGNHQGLGPPLRPVRVGERQ
jgi:hypothetical protein